MITTNFKYIKSISLVSIFTLPYSRKKKPGNVELYLVLLQSLSPFTYLLIHTLEQKSCLPNIFMSS